MYTEVELNTKWLYEIIEGNNIGRETQSPKTKQS